MRRAGFIGVAALLLVLAGLPAGCEWSGGSSNSFNTSRGAGVSLNISGFYEGQGAAGRAVETSRGNIRNFTISQNGNRIDVIDNQGSRYRGSVGAPDVFGTAGRGGTIQPATRIMQFQVSWRGTDGVAGTEVQFVGIIDVVSVDSIRGTETTTTRTDTQTEGVQQEVTGTRSAGDSREQQTEEDSEQETNGPGQIIEDIGDGTNIVGQVASLLGVVVTNIQTTASQSTESSATQTTQRGREVASDRETSTITRFELTPANTRFRLRGTWVEAGGRASNVNAISTGSGTISITADGAVTTGPGAATTGG